MAKKVTVVSDSDDDLSPESKAVPEAKSAKKIQVQLHDDPEPTSAPGIGSGAVVEPATEGDATELPSAPEVVEPSKPKPISVLSLDDAEQDTKPNQTLEEKLQDAAEAAAKQLGADVQGPPELPANDAVTKAEDKSDPVGGSGDDQGLLVVDNSTTPVGAAESDAVAVDNGGSEPTKVEVSNTQQGLADPQVLAAPPPPAVTETADAPEPLLDDTLDNPAIDHAVEDIVAKESDELLAAEDLRRVSQYAPVTREPRQRRSIRRFFAHKAVRWSVAGLFVAALIALGVIPATRYAVLNTAGVRASASIKIVDQSTQQPLKSVHVTIGGVTVDTNADGVAQLSNVPLGKASLTIQKRAFAPITESHTIGWGSNPLGERKVTPVGSQYSFTVQDYLSKKAIGSASVNAGDADANADDQGQMKLTMEHSDAASVDVTVSAPGYRSERITIDTDTTSPFDVRMVPDKRHAFISQRSGKYDVYAIDIDGKNEKLVLGGTGRERSDIILSSHPTADATAVVSTRDEKYNNDGYLMSTLTVINLDDDNAQSVVQSEQVSICGWSGNRLIYLQIAAGASAANPSRQRLMSYDYMTHESKQLASSNYFNDVLVVDDQVFYAPSSSFQASNTIGLYRVNPDGSNLQTIISQETWSVYRTDYDMLAITAPNQWYSFVLNATSATKLDGEPSNTTSRMYVDSPDKTRSAWVDKRDGKGVIVTYDKQTRSEQVVYGQSGLIGPVRWLSNSVVTFRINTDQETADYVLSLDGGDPVKIRDVTQTNSVDRWYYY